MQKKKQMNAIFDYNYGSNNSKELSNYKYNSNNVEEPVVVPNLFRYNNYLSGSASES